MSFVMFDSPLVRLLVAVLLSAAPSVTRAAHPFITDDAGTQGRGGRQLELNTDWLRFPENRSQVAAITYTYGRLDNLDLFVNAPLGLHDPAGIGNVSLGLKWRFLDRGANRLAFKPELLLPSSGEDKGLGSGGPGIALTLIGSRETGPWQLHANIGLTASRYREQATAQANRNVLWRLSLGAARQVGDRLSVIGDIGAARNPAPSSDICPAFALIGLIYSPRENLDLDVGVKFGLTRAEVNRQAGIGVTWRF